MPDLVPVRQATTVPEIATPAAPTRDDVWKFAAKLSDEDLDEFLKEASVGQAIAEDTGKNGRAFLDHMFGVVPKDEKDETKADEAPSETKASEAIIHEVVKDVVKDALGMPRAEKVDAKVDAKAPPEAGDDKMDEAKEVYDELLTGTGLKRVRSDLAEEAAKVAKVDAVEPPTPRPVSSMA